jgi:hypothetical protein
MHRALLLEEPTNETPCSFHPHAESQLSGGTLLALLRASEKRTTLTAFGEFPPVWLMEESIHFFWWFASNPKVAAFARKVRVFLHYAKGI